MSRSVRISLKTARDILEIEESHHGQSVLVDLRVLRGLKELRAAMEPKHSVRASAARRVVKRATKKEKRQSVRAAVMARADGHCEYCGTDSPVVPLHMDHMFGRIRQPETERTCWALCSQHHDLKTRNFPSAAHWFQHFAFHCESAGFPEEAALALKERDWHDAKNAASEAASMTRGAQP
jgi:5-methylcytosine-specific restriction endonuclease McrA